MITLDFDIKALIQGVEKIAAYEGGRSKDDASAYLRIAITEEDHPKLRLHLPEICSLLEMALADFKTVAAPDASVICVQIHTTNRWQSLHQDAVRKGIEAYFLNLLAAKWFSVVAPEFAVKYEGMANSELTGLPRLLHRKAPPIRRYDSGDCMTVK